MRLTLVSALAATLALPASAQDTVTVLRGSSAPPPAPAAPAPTVIVQRETVIVPGYPAPAYFYVMPIHAAPSFHRHRQPAANALPSGWPLLGAPVRRR